MCAGCFKRQTNNSLSLKISFPVVCSRLASFQNQKFSIENYVCIDYWFEGFCRKESLCCT